MSRSAIHVDIGLRVSVHRQIWRNVAAAQIPVHLTQAPDATYPFWCNIKYDDELCMQMVAIDGAFGLCTRKIFR